MWIKQTYCPFMFILQYFGEDYFPKNSILDWNIFNYIPKQAAARIHRILKLYYNDLFCLKPCCLSEAILSVWSHIVCLKPCCLSEAILSVWSHIVCLKPCLSEAILSVFELHSTIFSAFLDSMWTVDTVRHAWLINKLKTLRIKGPLLRIIYQCYTDMKYAIFVNGVASSWFPVNCDVRQVGVLSTNSLLMTY